MILGVAAEAPLEMNVAHLPAPVVATVTKMTEAPHDALMTEKVGDDGGTERMIGTPDHGDVMEHHLVDALKVFLINL